MINSSHLFQSPRAHCNGRHYTPYFSWIQFWQKSNELSTSMYWAQTLCSFPIPLTTCFFPKAYLRLYYCWYLCWYPCLVLLVDWSPHHACWALPSLIPFYFHMGIKRHTADHWIWIPSPRGWIMHLWSWGEAVVNEVNLDQQKTWNRKELNE